MKRLLLLLLPAVAALAAGCATTSRLDADPRIVVDPSVSSAIQVLTVDYGETQGANPVVSLAVRNDGGTPRRIRYRAVWFAPDGNPVDSILSIWKSSTLDPGEIADIRAVSPRPDAQDFRIEIRKGR